MDAYELFKTLRNGYPFIYYSASIGYKYIGLPVFRDCTQEEIELYKTYTEELNMIHRLEYTPNERDTKKLVKTLNEILVRGTVVYNDNLAKESANNLWDSLEKLPEGEIASFAIQREYLIESFDYRDGAFYRHSK